MANSKRRCKECREYFPAEDVVRVPSGSFCTFDHAIAFANRKTAERAAKEAEKARKINEDFAKRVKSGEITEPTIAQRLKKCEKVVNEYVRLRDKGLPCISCDWPDDGTNARHASHFRSVGACSSMRFNTLNIHASCAQCNSMKSGNISQYRPRLIEKIGEAKVDWIERQPIQYRFEKDYLIKLEATFKKLVKRQKKRIEERQYG